MHARMQILLIAALLPAVAGAAVRPATASAPRSPGLLSSAPTRIDRADQVLVPVMIDGKGPFQFLVDTGANGSMISPRLVKALGLALGQGVVERVEGVTGTEPLPWVLIRRLQVGRIVACRKVILRCVREWRTRIEEIANAKQHRQTVDRLVGGVGIPGR